MFDVKPDFGILPKSGLSKEKKEEERDEVAQLELESYLMKRYGARRLRRHQREMDEKERSFLSVVDSE